MFRGRVVLITRIEVGAVEAQEAVRVLWKLVSIRRSLAEINRVSKADFYTQESISTSK